MELVRQGQLVGAARQLKVDQTTVGRRIRELEKSLKCKLFNRTKTGFVLTETGRHLLENAEVMESQASAIAEVVGVEAPDSGGSVRVATMEGIGSLYLGPRIHRFYETHPSVLVELVTTSRWISLTKREADFFISFPKPADRRLSTEKIGEFNVGLYAAPAYLERFGVPRSKNDLDNHCFVDYVEDLVEIEVVGWLSEGEKVGIMDYMAATRAREALGLLMNRFHQTYDLLVTPTVPITAFAVGQDVPDPKRQKRWIEWATFSYPFNLTGQPAATIPCGFTSEGLPVGLQVIGPLYSDDLVLRASHAFEAAKLFIFPSLTGSK